jgi:transcriptional regulator of arginine metabolism
MHNCDIRMNKEARQKKILDLIRSERIGTQEELAAWLERAGFSVTQASVSRDLAELGLVKRNGCYAPPGVPRQAIAHGLFGLHTAGDALVVAKCEPGLASAVAVAIDAAKLPEIVGTIAGEDTIFIAVNDAQAQRMAIKKIWELF